MRFTRALTIVVVIMIVAIPSSFAAANDCAIRFDDFFTTNTMRVDYVHTGDAKGETISIDQIVSDGAWAGSRTRLVDPLNLGTYLFEVIDPKSNTVVYSRGYATLFNEYQTTDEAKTTPRTFSDSLRFPWPRAEVQLVIMKRDAANHFQQLWSTMIDPASRAVNNSQPARRGKVWSVFQNGDPVTKVDLLVLGDGYTTGEIDKFHADVNRLVGKLFATEPFKSRKSDFNVWAIDLPTEQSGVLRPRENKFRRTPIGLQYNIFDSERYMLTYDNRALRDIAAEAPYEFIEILANEKKYGGGGIFGDQATAAVDTAFAEYVFVHEFGHHFAGLADEYYTSDVAYDTSAKEFPEPWEPNVTALHDPANLKWKDLVEAGTPIPTPWEKEAFEKASYAIQKRRRELLAKGAPESEIDTLFREEQQAETKLLGSMKYSGKVGAFEGASYEAKGLYRPQTDCIMFTRDEVGFCRVCQHAISNIIDLYSKP